MHCVFNSPGRCAAGRLRARSSISRTPRILAGTCHFVKSFPFFDNTLCSFAYWFSLCHQLLSPVFESRTGHRRKPKVKTVFVIPSLCLVINFCLLNLFQNVNTNIDFLDSFSYNLFILNRQCQCVFCSFISVLSNVHVIVKYLFIFIRQQEPLSFNFFTFLFNLMCRRKYHKVAIGQLDQHTLWGFR